MPIGFARMQILQRRAGHDARQRYNYIARLGEHARRGDLALGPVTLAPPDTPTQLTGAGLWSAVETQSGRKDAIVGAELVLALPRFSELGADAATALVASFCQAMIVSHGLGASYAIHGVHEPEDAEQDAAMAIEDADGPSIADLLDMVSSWPHAHVLVTPRALGPDGLSPRRCTILEPLVRGAGKNRTVLCAVPWPKIWTRYLNAALTQAGSDQRVRLKAPHSGQHIGPARALALLQGDIERGEAPEGQIWPRLNAKIEARNARTLLAAPELSEPFFTRAEVADLLSRYLDLAGPALAARADMTLEAIDALPLPDLLTGEPTAWLSTRATLERARRSVGLAQSLGSKRAPSALSGEAVATTIARLERDHDLTPAIMDCLAHGHRLVTIETGDFGSLLPALDEIATHAGMGVIHLGHKAMTLAALGRQRVRFVIPSQIEKKLSAGDLVIVDRPDALELADLETLLDKVLRCNCRLLFVRRPHTLIFPRSPILDRVAVCGPTHALPSSADAILPGRMAPVDRDLAALADILRHGHARVFVDRASRLAYARKTQSHKQPTRFVGLSAADRQALGLDEHRPPPSRGAAAAAERLDEIIVLLPDAERLTPLYGHCPPERTALLIDAGQIPTLAHLISATARAAGDQRLFLAAAAFGTDEALAGEIGFDLPGEIARLYGHHVRAILGSFRTPGSTPMPGMEEALTMPIAGLVAQLDPAQVFVGQSGAGGEDFADGFDFPPDDDLGPEDFLDAEDTHDDDPSHEPSVLEQAFEDDDALAGMDEPSDDFAPDAGDESDTR
jgi:hypothetical protein